MMSRGGGGPLEEPGGGGGASRAGAGLQAPPGGGGRRVRFTACARHPARYAGPGDSPGRSGRSLPAPMTVAGVRPFAYLWLVGPRTVGPPHRWDHPIYRTGPDPTEES